MQHIDIDIGRQYELGIKNVIPYRDTFILNTTDGKKLLRKMDISPERISFIHGAKEHLFRNGFLRLDRYLCTAEGSPCLVTGDGSYTLIDYIDGEECNFDLGKDVILASEALAKLHNASKGFRVPDGAYSKNELGSLPGTFEKRLNEIRRVKKIAGKGKSKFDYMILECIDYFYNQGIEALEGILDSSYSRAVEVAEREGSFCHHDYTHYNILLCREEVAVVNFNYCCFELKVYDIANLIRRKARKCNWNVNEAARIIESYSRFENIENDDFFIMHKMLQFPQKFWRVINRYYNNRKGWTEKIYLAKLKEVVDEIPYHSNFLKEFDKVILPL